MSLRITFYIAYMHDDVFIKSLQWWRTVQIMVLSSFTSKRDDNNYISSLKVERVKNKKVSIFIRKTVFLAMLIKLA